MRIFLGALLSLTLALIGFIAAGTVASFRTVSAASALADAATTAIAALAGAAGGLVVAVLLARRLTVRRLSVVTGIAAMLAVALTVLVWRRADQRTREREHRSVGLVASALPAAGTPDTLRG